jgi:hypothetical protein
VTAGAEESRDIPLAALITAAARGKRLTDQERDTLRRTLIRMKKNGNVSYGAIGSAYGLSGREMKQVRRVAMSETRHP